MLMLASLSFPKVLSFRAVQASAEAVLHAH